MIDYQLSKVNKNANESALKNKFGVVPYFSALRIS